MTDLSRRRVLQAGCAIGLGSLTGCLGDSDPGGEDSPERPGGTTNGTASLTDWERSTDCDSMHDSVVSVTDVATSVGDEYEPIQYAALTAGEQEIVDTVTETGGYGTCDPGDAFSQFRQRVGERRRDQAADDTVYLERDGTCYGLYLEYSDQVSSY